MKLRFCFISVITLLLSFSETRVSYAGTPYWSDLEWSPDGDVLGAAGFEVTLYTDNLEVIKSTNRGEYSFLYNLGISWNTDGSAFATIERVRALGNNCEFSIWDQESFKSIKTVTYCDGDKSINISDPIDWNGNKIFTSGGVNFENYPIYVFDPNDLTLLDTIFKPEEGTFSPFLLYGEQENATVVFEHTSGSGFDGTLEAYAGSITMATEEIAWHVSTPDVVHAFAWNNATELAIGGIGFTGIYDTKSGELMQMLYTDSEQQDSKTLVRTLEWSPNGHYLAIGLQRGLEIWSLMDGRKVRTLWEDQDVDQLAWQPNGTKLAASGGSFDPEIKLFDVSDLPQ